MSRTITAMFDTRSEAEEARTRLSQSNIDADNVKILDQSSASSTGSTDSTGGSSGGGFWQSVKDAFLPDEDRHAYQEGINRGGYLLCATVDESEADEAVRVLESSNSVDFDERQQQWRNEGWTGYQGSTGGGFGSTAGMMGGTLGATGSAGSTTGTTGASTHSTSALSSDLGSTGRTETGRTVEEERIPIVEEQLRVGKREVSRGGARVRSYVEEVPVHERVNLREEHVSVERRPVDQPLGARDINSGDLLRERNIEMTETAEEVVVGKEARVREELVIRKTAEEHEEEVHDTVRHTEVDVDEGVAGSQNRSAFGSFGNRDGDRDNDGVRDRDELLRTERGDLERGDRKL